MIASLSTYSFYPLQRAPLSTTTSALTLSIPFVTIKFVSKYLISKSGFIEIFGIKFKLNLSLVVYE